MNFAKTACAGAMMLATSWAAASGWALRLTDFALPGQASTVEVVGWCNELNGYAAVDLCYALGPAFTLTTLESTDKSLRFKITDLQAVTTVDGIANEGFDYVMAFKELGLNPAIADDILRVQFNVLDTPAGDDGQGNALSMAELTVSLISGALVPDYLNSLPGTAVNRGTTVNGVNEAVSLLGDVLGFSGIGRPLDLGRGLSLDGLIVTPTAVPEPGTLASVGWAGLALAAVTALARRRGRRQAGQGRSPNGGPASAPQSA
ncbi:hypothetical protein [Ideonella sp. A 288]|uniref:hypothetical protein n=1 Tax=Ideonella sp. A 288 TaxID=1962181 RepID=UPI000B4A8D29|nr:hypothetical protein [Ideonella sp. A 288]